MLWVTLDLADCRPSGSGLQVDAGDEGQSWELPCPTDQWLRFLLAMGTHGGAGDCWYLIRRNPSLLLIGLALFRQAHGEAASCPKSMVDWLVRDGLAPASSLDVRGAAWPKFAATLDDRFWERYLRARRCPKLRRSLKHWLRQTTELDSDQRRAVLDQVVAATFHPAMLESRRLRRASTRQQVQRVWQQPVEATLPITELVNTIQVSARSAKDWQAALAIEKMAAMKQLAYGASHEINNPLANIATRAQTMLANEDHPEKRQKLAVIYQQAMRAHEMISDMMLFAHPPALRPQTVLLPLLMRRFINLQEPLIERVGGIRFRLTLGPRLAQAKLDPTQLLEALGSLVQNSVEAIETRRLQQSPRDPRNVPPDQIDIHLVRTEKDELQISVADSGVGFSGDQARHLFDPFYSGREAGRGLGFGLCKVWRIVELHGGQVWLDSASQGATRFVLRIPLSGASGFGVGDCWDREPGARATSPASHVA